MDTATVRSVAQLVAAGLIVGAALTAVTSLAGGHHPDAVSWLSTVATVAALVVAIGIYAAQRRDQDIARQELLDRLDAQDELLNSLAQQEPAQAGDDDLSESQREEVERRYGPDSIAATWRTGSGGRGNGPEPRLVRLRDGQVAVVYSAGRDGERTIVRPLNQRHGRRPRRDQPRDRG